MVTNKLTILTLVLITIILVLFNVSRSRPLPSYKILKVENTDEFYIDFNKNNKIDDNELVKLYDINAFRDIKDYQTKYQQRLTGLTMPEALGIGVLAKEFSQKTFTDKTVKVKFIDIEANKTKKYSRAKLYLYDTEISKILLQNGFALNGRKENKYKKYLNFVNITKLRNNLKLENIVILNTQNNTYHRLDCDYAQKLKNALALRKDLLPKDAKPCPKCILHSKAKEESSQNFQLQNFDFSSGVFNFYFTDFNKRLKPDSQCQNSACKALLHQINNAKSSIDFAIYGIANQPDIIEALTKAQNRGVKIRWVSDADTKGNNIYSEVASVQKLLHNYKTDNHIITGEVYKNPKYINSIMHNKFFIFDKQYVWFGSANLSQTDLADFNANIIVLANSKTLANIYQQEFDQMFNEKFHYLKKPVPGKENIKADSQNICSVYFSPTDKIITTKIIPLINNAKNYIYISSFIITHNKIKSALINAKNRGVDIKIITDATSARGKYSVHETLRENGVLVKVENKAGKLHTKSLVIDDKYSIIGSMNLTNSAENKNDENVIVFTNPKIAKVFKKQFLYLWSSIPEKWLYRNPRAEGPESLGSCFDGIDNDFDGFIDKDDPGCKYAKQ